MEKNKTVNIWFAVNKSGFVGLYANEPQRNTNTGKWESKFPVINSQIYDQIVALAQKAGLTWENDPECININFES